MNLCTRTGRPFYIVLGLVVAALAVAASYATGWLAGHAAHQLTRLPIKWEDCAPMSAACWTETYEGPTSFAGRLTWGVACFGAVAALAFVTPTVLALLEKLGRFVCRESSV